MGSPDHQGGGVVLGALAGGALTETSRPALEPVALVVAALLALAVLGPAPAVEPQQVVEPPGSVFDTLVVGMKDERWGQRVTALVQFEEGQSADLEALQEELRRAAEEVAEQEQQRAQRMTE